VERRKFKKCSWGRRGKPQKMGKKKEEEERREREKRGKGGVFPPDEESPARNEKRGKTEGKKFEGKKSISLRRGEKKEKKFPRGKGKKEGFGHEKRRIMTLRKGEGKVFSIGKGEKVSPGEGAISLERGKEKDVASRDWEEKGGET